MAFLLPRLLPLLCLSFLAFALGCQEPGTSDPLLDCERCDSFAAPLLTITLSEEGELVPRYSRDLVLPGYLEVSVWATFNEEDPSLVDVGLEFYRKDRARIPRIGKMPTLRTTRKWEAGGIAIDMPLRVSTITLKAKGEEDLPLTLSYQAHARGFTARDGYTAQSVDDEWVDFYHAFKIVATAGEATSYTIVRPRFGDDILTSLDREGSLDWRALSDAAAYEIGYNEETDELSVERLEDEQEPGAD